MGRIWDARTSRNLSEPRSSELNGGLPASESCPVVQQKQDSDSRSGGSKFTSSCLVLLRDRRHRVGACGFRELARAGLGDPPLVPKSTHTIPNRFWYPYAHWCQNPLRTTSSVEWRSSFRVLRGPVELRCLRAHVHVGGSALSLAHTRAAWHRTWATCSAVRS